MAGGVIYLEERTMSLQLAPEVFTAHPNIGDTGREGRKVKVLALFDAVPRFVVASAPDNVRSCGRPHKAVRGTAAGHKGGRDNGDNLRMAVEARVLR